MRPLARAQPLPPAPRPAARPHDPPLALPERYAVRSVLGSGAMGTVVLARDRRLGRLVAIKLLATDCATLLARLRREARLLARLEHPAIVRVHDLDVHAGTLHVAMEYAPGGSLAGAELAPLELVRTLRGVVDALALAHAEGVVHRDVKPENVLLTGAGAPAGRGPALLSDFGLACGPGEGTPALRRAVVGTPLTMSPEQADGRPVGPASDVFSLGATLYRQLTGAWPFDGGTVDEVLDAVRRRDPLPPRARRPAVPRRLDGVVRRSLAKDPAERFASMDALGRALDRVLAGRALFALPLAWPRRARARARSSASGRTASGRS